MIILSLDLAITSGWARGAPGTEPTYDSLRFASQGASHAAIFGNTLEWLITETAGDRCPDMIVYEAPIIAKWGKTNAKTNEILQGLPALVEAVAFMRGIHGKRLRRIHVSKVRSYFIGKDRCERKEAKQLTIRKCKLLRWHPQDDNAADALALWSYQCAQLDPATSIKVTPLFMHTNTRAG
jgi:hypothetical protein